MDLSLSRVDYLHVAPISNQRTLKVLPLGKKKRVRKAACNACASRAPHAAAIQQRFVVGDDTGTVGCYSVKKGAHGVRGGRGSAAGFEA